VRRQDGRCEGRAVPGAGLLGMLREVPTGTTPELATIAALVHDIGKLIMVRHLKADVATILVCCDERKCTFV
jgi:hypothetical protein